MYTYFLYSCFSDYSSAAYNRRINSDRVMLDVELGIFRGLLLALSGTNACVQRARVDDRCGK